ncbi:ArnT family glycosyltransferase [Amphritea japonica]|uniref:Glycosyl transferase family 39 n=1 Tax=Amphritea japonica ATCC BAA-1530 TaxID=1278309 RepID=A0A7R6P160_9GAMM|nr:glycosyltransferase family 39 protein [Amphritea japonica]BBB24934.1 glycosyl transferase family 39 [Amphritea japonica ATCC BAA-1530]
MSLSAKSTPAPLNFLWLLAGYILLHLFIRLGMGGTLELDEAEQVILGQQLELGYNTQPPLYTWIQWLFFQLLGTGVFALAVLKSLLLFSIYLFTWLIARQVIPNQRMALLASFSLCLIPSVAWESVRDLTHTVLVTAIASATFYTVFRIYQTRALSGYIALGILLACGMLAKYSFGLFAASLLLSALSVREYRGLILNRRILISISIVILLFLPHLLWAVGHLDEIKAFIGGQVGEGSEASYLNGVLAGFSSLAKNAAEFLILVWLVLTLIFPSAYKPLSVENECVHRVLIARFLIAGGLICIALILLFGTTQFQSRWFQPLLIFFPLYMLSRVETVGSPVRRETILRSVIVFFIVIVVVLRFAQFWLAPYVKRNANRMQYPSAELAQQLKQEGFTQGTIIGDSNLTAANLSLYFDGARILSPNTEFFIADPSMGSGQCLVVWKATRHDNMPLPQVNYLKRLGIDAQSKPYRYITAPYRYADSGEHRLGYVLFVSEKQCSGSDAK